MVSGEPSNGLPGPPTQLPVMGGHWGVPLSPAQGEITPQHPNPCLGLGALTTASKEEEVPGEEAGGAAEGRPVQHIHHVAHGVARCGERLEGQAAHAHLLPVCKWAVPGTGSTVRVLPSTPAPQNTHLPWQPFPAHRCQERARPLPNMVLGGWTGG